MGDLCRVDTLDMTGFRLKLSRPLNIRHREMTVILSDGDVSVDHCKLGQDSQVLGSDAVVIAGRPCLGVLEELYQCCRRFSEILKAARNVNTDSRVVNLAIELKAHMLDDVGSDLI